LPALNFVGNRATNNTIEEEMKDLIEQERAIDLEIAEELEKFNIERELIGGDVGAGDPESQSRSVDGEEFDNVESRIQLPGSHLVAGASSRDMSMISASSASSISASLTSQASQPPSVMHALGTSQR
jgi:hypothetical protein